MRKLPNLSRNSAFLLLFLLAFTLLSLSLNRNYRIIRKIYAESLEEIEDKIEEKQDELKKIKEKANEISSNLNSLSGKLNITRSQITNLENEIAELSKDIQNLSAKMVIKRQELDERETLRNLTLRNLYVNNKVNILEIILSGNNLVNSTQQAFYFQSFIDNSESLIMSINGEIKKYESDKKEIEEIKTQIEKQRADLLALSKKISSDVSSAQGELANVSQKQSAVERELSELSQKQKALLAEKTETFSTSVGDVPITGDPNSGASYDPGFRKAFATFSFGAPHRKGMSQYGAKGRAESGQNYEEILKDYYGDITIVEPDNMPSQINTSSGTMDLDGKYLKGLAEMPASWPMDALKAQAIAARTYAMSYVGYRYQSGGGNGSICTTESCQVWSSSKASSSSAARWHEAVNATKGKIMIGKNTNEIFSAFYASTSGGYNYQYTSLGHTTSGGWDTKCDSRDCWTSDAYESIAGSPWFYKGWYKSRSSKSCGRSHPWLTEEEFADIIGAMVLYKDDSNNQKHLSQPDANTCWDEDIEDTWSRSEVKEKSGITDINDVSVSYSSGGYTAEVKVKTNKGEYKFSGEEYKAIFNLRAPGVIHIKSLLFNVEVKE